VKVRALLVLLLLLMFAQLICGARQLSLTSDEPSHIVAGLTYLATGELWVPPLHGHPPFLNALGAWPLLLQPERPDFAAMPGWGSDFSTYVRHTWLQLGPVERLAFATRLPNMWLALLLAALVFRWASQLFDRRAALLAVALMTFDPNLIAHAQLNTTDLGVTLTGFALLYLGWQGGRAGGRNRQHGCALAAGALLGLTLAGKASGILYAPALLAVLAWGHISWWRERGWAAHLKRWLVEGALIGGTALAILWAIYLLEVGPLVEGGLPLPFPSHIGMLEMVFQDVQRVAFLRGQVKIGGWWWYFPYSTAIKTPIPLLVGMGLVAVTWLRGRRWLWWRTLPLLLFPALYWASAMVSAMNIGHRHLLPTFPLCPGGPGGSESDAARKVAHPASRPARGPVGLVRRGSACHLSFLPGLLQSTGGWAAQRIPAPGRLERGLGAVLHRPATIHGFLHRPATIHG